MKALRIDDEPNVRTPLFTTIKLAGYEQVDTAATGEEALEFALQTKYDLITVDIQIPDVSGLEMLTVLRGSAPHAVIAIISAYTERIREEDTKYADLVLPKPLRYLSAQPPTNPRGTDCHDRRLVVGGTHERSGHSRRRVSPPKPKNSQSQKSRCRIKEGIYVCNGLSA